MTQKTLLGYNESLLIVASDDNQTGYDYYARTYKFSPIYPVAPGSISTAAFRLCRECGGVISSSGGPGHRSVCLTCYPLLKIADFAQGHVHEIVE